VWPGIAMSAVEAALLVAVGTVAPIVLAFLAEVRRRSRRPPL